jgi:type VI secretion system secreted protein VgrG
MDEYRLRESIRTGLLQQDRLLRLDTPLPANTFVPRRALAVSALGRDFSWTLDVVSGAGDVELKKLIAQPVTAWLQQADKSYRPFNGYVHTARRLGADGGLTSYQLVFASWLHFLRFRRDERIWQDRPADAIIADVFNEHPQARGHFQFALSKPLPSRSYCRQSETDWNFVHRLLEAEGLYGFWRHADDGKSHTFVITDTPQSLDAMTPDTIRFHRADLGSERDALTQWAGSRTLQSTAFASRTFDYKQPSTPHNPKGTSLPTKANQGELPGQTEVYEYTGAYTYGAQANGDRLSAIRLEEWESRAKRFHGVGGVRGADAGRRFHLAGHPEHDRDAAEQREFVIIGITRVIENNLPLGGGETNFPHSLAGVIAEARATGASAAASVPHAGDGAQGFYHVEIEAQRASVPYRSAFEHAKPEMHLETAIVVGPKGEEVYTDDLNRHKVQFVWDRLNAGDERASCWLRAAFSDSGAGYGAVHPLRVGEEVIVDYVGGDCDRPLITARVYNGAVKPQWHSNGILSGYRTKEYAGSGYNQMVFDDATGQNRAQLFSSQGNTHLHLGYLIQQDGNARGPFLGQGFDLRTDAYGAVRAGSGLYVTTYPKSAASQPFDASDTHRQLGNAQQLLDALSNASATHHAESLSEGRAALGALSDVTRDTKPGGTTGGRTAGGGTGSAAAFKEPAMLFGSPTGIGLSTQQSTQISADQHINVVSGQSTHVAAGKSLIASVTEKLSLFAQNAGMKLFAGKGKVEIQAHSDNIELTAQKTVKILSATQTIEVASPKEVLLTSGGAYVRIAGGNIEIHAPGKIDIKGATHAFEGPAQRDYPLPALPIPADAKRFSNRVDFSGLDAISETEGGAHAWAHTPYYVTGATGAVIASGVTDRFGQGERFFTREQEDVHVWMEKDEWLSSEELEAPADAPGAPAGAKMPDCSYLDGSKGRIDAPPDFYTPKNTVTMEPPQDTKFKFPGGGEQDALLYKAKINDHPFDILVPKSGGPTGTALPDAQSMATALSRVSPKQLADLSRVSMNPAPNPADADWRETYNDPNFYSAATASIAQGVAFYPWKGWETIPQQYVDSTMTHETGHLWSEALWKNAKLKQDYLAAIAKDGKAPSDYGSHNPTEDFAESANMYWSSQGTPCEQEGRKRYPARYDYFDKIAK